MAGNMVNYDGVTRTYNAANQMTNDGTNTLTYDNNGNLRTVGSDTYTWDRANRLTDVGNHSYVYDGLGNRVQQTVSSVVTDYLNDVQPGLTKLLKQTTGANVERFVHGLRGIHAVDDGTNWNYYAQDGLGSVRAIVDDAGGVQSSMAYDPYGNPMASYGEGFGFTGEQTDANGLVFLRARYYEPEKGVFSALDPFEGVQSVPMSLNGYSWVEGNVPNGTDPNGMCGPLCWALIAAAAGLVLTGCGVQPTPINVELPPSQMPNQLNTSTPTPTNTVTPRPLPTGTPTNTVTPSPTNTPSPTVPPPTATLGSCPSDALLGCSPNTTNPILAVVVAGSNTHTIEGAIDFVPSPVVGTRETSYFVNDNWEVEYPANLRTVHAIVSGTIILPDFSGDVRIRTNEGICYDYKHITRDGTQISIQNGASIQAGTPLGIIESHGIDADAGPPSHGHLAIFPCNQGGNITEQGSQIPPLSVLNRQYIVNNN